MVLFYTFHRGDDLNSRLHVAPAWLTPAPVPHNPTIRRHKAAPKESLQNIDMSPQLPPCYRLLGVLYDLAALVVRWRI